MIPNIIKISAVYCQTSNYTPAGVMQKWARDNGSFLHNGLHGYYLRFFGNRYYYHHWKIKKHSDGMETVTITLVKKDGF